MIKFSVKSTCLYDKQMCDLKGVICISYQYKLMELMEAGCLVFMS